jgi:transposase
MCLQPEILGMRPQVTAVVARAAFPGGNLYLRIRDELGPLFADAAFVPFFSRRG